jgi:hypothetical protein
MYPKWSSQGDELFFVDSETNTLMVVPVEVPVDGKTSIVPGDPRPLFSGDPIGALLGDTTLCYFAVASDGQRFLVVKNMASLSIVMVTNWSKEFQNR